MNNARQTDSPSPAVKNLLFTWSNLISLSRIIVALPVIYLHRTSGGEVGPLIIALAVYGILSDFLDGWVARKTGSVSELGKILDPLADKICAFLLFGYTVWIGLVPLWFFILVVLRDLLIMWGSLWIRWTRGKVAMAVLSGKVSVNALALYWLSVFFFPAAHEVHTFFMGNAIALMILSFIDYFHRFNKIRHGSEFR